VQLSPACIEAENAWKDAVSNGRDPVLESALAFMNASPSESPCYVSAKDYVQAIVNGAEHHDANLAAAKSFAGQIVNLANQGKSTIDPACARSAIAYSQSSVKPSAPYAAGLGEAASNEAAAVAYLDAVAVNPNFDPKSPCGRAADAYIASFNL